MLTEPLQREAAMPMDPLEHRNRITAVSWALTLQKQLGTEAAFALSVMSSLSSFVKMPCPCGLARVSLEIAASCVFP